MGLPYVIGIQRYICCVRPQEAQRHPFLYERVANCSVQLVSCTPRKARHRPRQSKDGRLLASRFCMAQTQQEEPGQVASEVTVGHISCRAFTVVVGIITTPLRQCSQLIAIQVIHTNRCRQNIEAIFTYPVYSWLCLRPTKSNPDTQPSPLVVKLSRHAPFANQKQRTYTNSPWYQRRTA